MTATVTIDHPKLTRADRCDQRACNASAGVRAVLPKGGELLFCAHHLQVNRARLTDIGLFADEGVAVVGASLPG